MDVVRAQEILLEELKSSTTTQSPLCSDSSTLVQSGSFPLISGVGSPLGVSNVNNNSNTKNASPTTLNINTNMSNHHAYYISSKNNIPSSNINTNSSSTNKANAGKNSFAVSGAAAAATPLASITPTSITDRSNRPSASYSSPLVREGSASARSSTSDIVKGSENNTSLSSPHRTNARPDDRSCLQGTPQRLAHIKKQILRFQAAIQYRSKHPYDRLNEPRRTSTTEDDEEEASTNHFGSAGGAGKSLANSTRDGAAPVERDDGAKAKMMRALLYKMHAIAPRAPRTRTHSPPGAAAVPSPDSSSGLASSSPLQDATGASSCDVESVGSFPTFSASLNHALAKLSSGLSLFEQRRLTLLVGDIALHAAALSVDVQREGRQLLFSYYPPAVIMGGSSHASASNNDNSCNSNSNSNSAGGGGGGGATRSPRGSAAVPNTADAGSNTSEPRPQSSVAAPVAQAYAQREDSHLSQTALSFDAELTTAASTRSRPFRTSDDATASTTSAATELQRRREQAQTQAPSDLALPGGLLTEWPHTVQPSATAVERAAPPVPVQRTDDALQRLQRSTTSTPSSNRSQHGLRPHAAAQQQQQQQPHGANEEEDAATLEHTRSSRGSLPRLAPRSSSDPSASAAREAASAHFEDSGKLHSAGSFSTRPATGGALLTVNSSSALLGTKDELTFTGGESAYPASIFVCSGRYQTTAEATSSSEAHATPSMGSPPQPPGQPRHTSVSFNSIEQEEGRPSSGSPPAAQLPNTHANHHNHNITNSNSNSTPPPAPDRPGAASPLHSPSTGPASSHGAALESPEGSQMATSTTPGRTPSFVRRPQRIPVEVSKTQSLRQTVAARSAYSSMHSLRGAPTSPPAVHIASPLVSGAGGDSPISDVEGLRFKSVLSLESRGSVVNSPTSLGEQQQAPHGPPAHPQPPHLRPSSVVPPAPGPAFTDWGEAPLYIKTLDSTANSSDHASSPFADEPRHRRPPAHHEYDTDVNCPPCGSDDAADSKEPQRVARLRNTSPSSQRQSLSQLPPPPPPPHPTTTSSSQLQTSPHSKPTSPDTGSRAGRHRRGSRSGRRHYYEIDRMRLSEFRSCLQDITFHLDDFTPEEFRVMGLTYAVPGVRELSPMEVATFNEQLRRSGAGRERHRLGLGELVVGAGADLPPLGAASPHTRSPEGSSVCAAAAAAEGSYSRSNSTGAESGLSTSRPPLLLPLFTGGERVAVERDQFLRFKDEVDKKLEEVEERLSWASMQEEETHGEGLNYSGSDGY